jgi:hypothetical protein
MGRWQRAILEAIGKSDKLIPLGGATRAEQAAILRAAKSLEKAGHCVIVRLWTEGHTVVRPYAGRPDLTFDGKPVKELNVARVPCGGTGTALTGSLRQLAMETGVSKTQIWRDIRDLNERDRP